MSRPPLPEGFDAEFPQLLALALRVTRRILHDADDAEDAAAEALARTVRKWDKVADLPHRDAWVQRVAANVAIDQLRRRRRPLQPAATTLDHADPLVGRLEVTDLLRGLPARQREVVVLRYLIDQSVEDTAALGISPNSVKTHTARALTALRRAQHEEDASLAH